MFTMVLFEIYIRNINIVFIFRALLVSVLRLTQKNFVPFSKNQHFSKISKYILPIIKLEIFLDIAWDIA